MYIKITFIYLYFQWVGTKKNIKERAKFDRSFKQK